MVTDMDRRRKRLGFALAAVCGLFAVAGCGDATTPEPTVTSSRDDDASTADLLAEAEVVYLGYLEVSNGMWNQTEVDHTLWAEWASDPIAVEEAAGHEQLRAQGVTTMGPIELAAFEPAGGAGEPAIDVFLCLDFSGAQRFDATGADVTPPDAVQFAPLQVRFERQEGTLIVTQQEALTDPALSPCP